MTLFTTTFTMANTSATHPYQLIAKTHSSTQVALSWQPPQDSDWVSGYRILRDGQEIGQTSLTLYIDSQASSNSHHTYQVIAFNQENTITEISNTDSVKTLENDLNDGLSNGSIIRTGVARLIDVCGTNSIDAVPTESLDTCLQKAIELNTLPKLLGDMKAYVARLRRQEDKDLINLGMRLFHSKSLSENYDTSCSSCHTPAVGCGSDALSMSIGVNAQVQEVIGVGRTDGALIPSVGRNSPPICNSALWVDSMFWDQRIALREANRDSPVGRVSTAKIRTPEKEVTRKMLTDVSNTDPLRLLIAQAHFPITEAAEMGDPQGHASPQAYREFIAQRLQTQWKDEFNTVFGDEDISFLHIARALAAYQASFLFIDNPFFDYVDGNLNSLNEDEKRGALFFYAGSGCANCHDGAMFTPERTRGPLYPQIGINAVDDGTVKNQFRMPSLLNVGITAPYGDKGVFPTLERVIEHYNDVTTSLEHFYSGVETCNLPQFKHLTQEQCKEVVGGGESFILELNAARREESDRGDDAIVKNFTPQEIRYLAAFLRSLTDPEARAGSNEINVLIPPRDGGPDGHQLNAVDNTGNAL
jgi:cytochrome c peroxidase